GEAAQTAPTLHWSGLTHRGHVRANNEDTFLALEFDGCEVHYLGKIGHATTAQKDFVFAVSDGMGGANSGEFASRITKDKITQLTHDHGHVGWLRRNHRIGEREAREHPMRNLLNQALGAEHQFIDPQFGALPCGPGDRFLLCSDGLTENLWDRQLDEIVRTA